MQGLKEHYQNLIIGFGKGGKTLAAYLAKHGQEVALIEKSEMMYGGTCINLACIPTKSLITSAEKHTPYEVAFEIKNSLISFLRKKNYDSLVSLPSATVITGQAAFLSEREVSVMLKPSGKEVRIHADRIFINTGTEPLIPEITGIGISKKVFTSASLMEQPVRPRRLIIIGAGFIGLEFADMYAKFGTEVTMLDTSNIFLPREDRDIADEIYKVMTAKKITILQGISVQSVKDTDDGLTVQFINEHGRLTELDADAALMATGRRPNLKGLNLEAAGIKTNGRGYVEVNDRLQTNVKNIWAIGDVNGGPQFTYISLDDFRIIRDQLSGGPYISTNNRKAVASSVFISPPLSHIGLREQEAREKGYRIKIARLPASSVPRARILNSMEGVLKSVIDADTNKILGCTLFCAESSEMINTIQIAINAQLDYQVIRDTVFTHPSMTEAFNDLYTL